MDPRIVDHPELPPGCCFLSRTSDGPFVDTGLDVDDLDPIGRIYLAESTIADLAQHLGFAPPVASARARDRIDELEKLLDEAESAVKALTDVNASLTAAGYVPRAPDRPLVVPAGAVRDVLFWVVDSDDYAVVLQRAAAARDAELAEDNPRKSLLDELDRSYLLRKEEPNAHQAQDED
jgi:hypothetical protein